MGVGGEERKERGGKINKGGEGRERGGEGRKRRWISSIWLSKGATTLLRMLCYMYTVQRRPALGSCFSTTQHA